MQEAEMDSFPVSRSILVFDNAAYHNVVVDRCPTTATRKADTQDWLTRHSIDFNVAMLKAELLELCKRHRQQPVYVVDEILAEHGHKAIHLPPYHADPNPIELIWANLKGHVAKRNLTFKQATVKEYIKEGVYSITYWSNCVHHVEMVEREYWAIDMTIDSIEESIIVDLESATQQNDLKQIQLVKGNAGHYHVLLK